MKITMTASDIIDSGIWEEVCELSGIMCGLLMRD